MKKLKLESLTVESFSTSPDPGMQRGTVRGQQGGHPSNDYTFCYVETCLYSCIWAGCYTQAPNNTCQNTCNPHVFTCGGNGSGGTDWTKCGENCHYTLELCENYTADAGGENA